MDDERDLLDQARDGELAERAADLDNVLEFRRRTPADDAKLDALAPAPRATCKHRRQRFVDEKQRTVTCGDCGAALDPVWCLLTLIDYRESLRRERAAIDGERAAMERRRQDGIRRRQLAKMKQATIRARENCERCRGTGWAPEPSGRGVRRCDCRVNGAKLV